jgi:hypothetical protein
MFNRFFHVYGHKYAEFEVILDNQMVSLFKFNVSLTQKCDHAGFNLTVCLLGLEAQFMIYDNRHWDYENNCWQTTAPEPDEHTIH